MAHTVDHIADRNEAVAGLVLRPFARHAVIELAQQVLSAVVVDVGVQGDGVAGDLVDQDLARAHLVTVQGPVVLGLVLGVRAADAHLKRHGLTHGAGDAGEHADGVGGGDLGGVLRVVRRVQLGQRLGAERAGQFHPKLRQLPQHTHLPRGAVFGARDGGWSVGHEQKGNMKLARSQILDGNHGRRRAALARPDTPDSRPPFPGLLW